MIKGIEFSLAASVSESWYCGYWLTVTLLSTEQSHCDKLECLLWKHSHLLNAVFKLKTA